MKRKSQHAKLQGFLLFIILLAALRLSLRPRQSPQNLRALESSAPFYAQAATIDKVELQKLKTKEEIWFESIEATKTY